MLTKAAAVASDAEPEPFSSKGIMNQLPALCGLHKIYDGGRWRLNYG